jgi:hypothetical protein
MYLLLEKRMPLNTRSRPILAVLLALTLLILAVSPWAGQPALAAGFTVANLNDAGAGSLRQAILDANASPVADTISFAPATNGGTIVLASALPDLANSGALTIAGNGAANTTVSGNNSVRVFSVASGAVVSISGITITGGNPAGGSGGGISNSGTLTIISSRVDGNRAVNGGGIYNGTGSTLTVTNSSISGNIAGDGAGIFGFGSTVTLNNSTLNANSALGVGGGISVNTVTTTINNTVIANSISGGGNDCDFFLGTRTIRNSLIEDGTCGIVNGVNGNLTGDPALNPDLTLGAGSSAIDAGSNALVPGGLTADLAGNARIQGARVDMGALESGFTAPPTNTPTPTLTPTATVTPGGPTLTPTSTSTATPVGAPNTPTPKPRKPRPTATPLGRITGTVINLTTGAPVPGIAVQVGDAVVTTDENGNYDRNGLAAGDYPVELRLTEGQGEPAQGVIVVTLPDGATVVQHLALRTPLPAPAAGPDQPAGTPLPAAASPPTEAGPAPVPAELPKTSGAIGLGWPLPALAAALILAGLRLRRRRVRV